MQILPRKLPLYRILSPPKAQRCITPRKMLKAILASSYRRKCRYTGFWRSPQVRSYSSMNHRGRAVAFVPVGPQSDPSNCDLRKLLFIRHLQGIIEGLWISSDSTGKSHVP